MQHSHAMLRLVLLVSVLLATQSVSAAETVPQCLNKQSIELSDPTVRGNKEAKNRSELSGVIVRGDQLLTVSNEGTGKGARQHVVQVFRRDGAARYVFDHDAELAKAARSDDDAEADFEAITLFGDRLFAITSHSRNHDKNPEKAKSREALIERLSGPMEEAGAIRSKLLSFKLSNDGHLSDRRSSSLRTYIDTHPVFERFAPLASKENGVDIEGLAATPHGLFVGFRGPVMRGNFVPLLRIDHDMSLAGDAGQLHFVTLGGRGVRDMTAVGDRIYILAGPNGAQDMTFRIFEVMAHPLPDMDDEPPALEAIPVCDLGMFPDAKPEGIAVIDEKTGADGEKQARRVILVFDADTLQAEARTLP